MPKNIPSTAVSDTTSVAPVTAMHPNPPPSSPFNYSVDEEVERQKALDRQTDKVPNAPFRPIL